MARLPDGDGVRAWAEVRETHIGVVFLVGENAYKLKKPVNLGFLDFTTRERREHACRRELELNRRLAPDVYLGIADITGPDGAVCDHLVVMRRMPDERRLATMVRRGAPLTTTIDRLARILAAFHAGARRGSAITAEGSRDAVRTRWEDSFHQVRPFHGSVLDHADALEIERRTEDFLAGRQALFDRRAAAGRIIDGHGDLLADDIFCLDDGPRVLDCLEFDDRLRWLDGLDDVAFLAMDLERLGAPELADRLLDRYADFANDPAPAALRHHYLAYRAFVRTKVACLRHAQGDAAAGELARTHSDIALRHLREGTVRLIVVGGLPGSGKSTVSSALADRIGAVVLRSDRIRKEIAGLVPEAPAPSGYRQGLYSPEHTARTYAEILRRADELLRLGETVVLDASWSSADDREAAARVAAETRSGLIALQCRAPWTTVTDRLATRTRSISDATPAIAGHMAMATEPWPEAHTVCTDGSEQDSVAQAMSYLT